MADKPHIPTSEGLLPCPFCGAEVHKVNIEGADFGDPEWQQVTCPRCATTSGASANKRLVIERWNTRVSPENPDD